MDKQIDKIVDGMVASGVPRIQALAIGMSIAHSLASPSYTAEYGTYLRASLLEFLETAGC
jgi:hypothetical protein